MDFATESLQEKSPRIKWESAKVIGNIVHLYPSKIDTALISLLANAEHEGIVVRWSAAYALGQILMMKTNINTFLLPIVETICNKEDKKSIKKIYESAFKKCK
jgi:HEAT repeat protein